MRLEKPQDDARTQKISQLKADSVIVGTISSIMKHQVDKPAFGVYPIESGPRKGSFIVSDGDGNTVIISKKDYKEKYFNPVVESGRFVLKDDFTDVTLNQTEWSMLNAAAFSTRRRRFAFGH